MTGLIQMVHEAAEFGRVVRLRGRADVIALERAHWRELERLSLEGDPETQAALNRFLDRRGHVLARTFSRNLVTTAGLNHTLSASLPNGAWFVGQKGAGAVSASDTMASHGAWSELTDYTQTTRPALTLSTPSGGSANNAAGPAIFTAPTGGMTFTGWFVANSSGKGGTTGTLYSAANHTAPQAILEGSALRQTLTATAT